ncbi:MAG TPA: hypothetical protein VG142_10615 [Trebonia sp.]|jgi:uncharacterized protein YukE|nr:hypothetical protein [Trebonia sp.]
MTYSVPTSFEPLASSNPVPADTDSLTSLGQQYTATANLIQTQATDLQNLTNNASDSWKSQAGTVFVSKASSLASRITQAYQRYETAGTALTAAAEPMYQAQQSAYAAVQQAQEAQSTMQANAPAPAPAPGSPAPTDAQKQEAATKASNYSNAQDSLNQAQSQFNSAVDDYHAAASACAKAINDELSSDPLKDSWFQDHFQWLLNLLHIFAIIAMAFAALVLLIALPGVGALIDGIGLTAVASAVTTFATAFGAGVGVAQTVIDGMGVHDGLQTVGNLLMDIVGDVAVGVGAGITKIAGTITKAATADGKAAVSVAAKSAVTQAAKDSASSAAKASVIDKATADAAGDFTKNNATGFITNDDLAAGAKAAGEAAGKAAEPAAAAAATAAVNKLVDDAGSTAVAKITKGLEGVTNNTPIGNLIAAGAQNPDIAQDLAELNYLHNAVPATAKIGTAIWKVGAIGAGNGALQWGAVGIGIYGIATG